MHVARVRPTGYPYHLKKSKWCFNFLTVKPTERKWSGWVELRPQDIPHLPIPRLIQTKRIYNSHP